MTMASKARSLLRANRRKRHKEKAKEEDILNRRLRKTAAATALMKAAGQTRIRLLALVR